MKQPNKIIFGLFLLLILPLAAHAKFVHYIPTQQQLQPSEPGVAPNIGHNINFESPASPFINYSAGASSSQPAGAGAPGAQGINVKQLSAAPAGSLGSDKFWTYILLLFAFFFTIVFIVLKKRDDKNEK